MGWFVGLVGSIGIAGAAYAKRSLSGSGFLAAVYWAQPIILSGLVLQLWSSRPR